MPILYYFIKEKDMCECNAKELCCKMQKESLRTAISKLKNNSDPGNVLRILRAISNVFEVYDCLPNTCLLQRTKWVYDNISISNKYLCTGEKIFVEMLINEIETFLDN